MLVAIFPAISHSQYSPAIEKINNFILQGKCSDAEAYARSYIQRPVMLTALGIISNDCRRNSTEAIGYFRLAAAENESVAIEFLNAMGVSYTNPRLANSNTSEPTQIIQSPPPHRLAPAPRPREHNIILVQPQVAAPVFVAPMFNPSACIQDGGGTYCPNHINSQIRPSYPYGR